MTRSIAHAFALFIGFASVHAAAKHPDSYVVRPGDTLGKIAKRFGLDIAELRRANGLKAGQRIFPHQRLVLPHHGPVAAAATGSAQASYAARPRQPGYVVITGARARWKGLVRTSDGISPEAEHAFEDVLAFWRDGEHHPIEPHLIELLVDVSDHFGGRPLHVVSGFRPFTPSQYTVHSRHNDGKAVDFTVEGVPNAVVRDYCRSLGAVGVGYYPNSSFVHLDVRDTATFWVDESGPGESPRYEPRHDDSDIASGQSRKTKPAKRRSAAKAPTRASK